MRTRLIAIAGAVAVASNSAGAMSEHAMNEEIMAQCDKLADTTSTQWDQAARLRGLTVTLNDCVKASAALAREAEEQSK